MLRAQLVICLDSEWLIAGGESTLGTADMAPMRDVEGLPTIPGRTLRGLLREAVTLLDECEHTNHADRMFGTRKEKNDTALAGDGTLRIGNALVVSEIAALCTDVESRADLFASIRRTALDTKTRSAKTGSLREMEVAIAGLELVAEVDIYDDADLQLLAFASGLVRSLGHSRSRGLGRCRIELWRNGKQIMQSELPTASSKGAIR